MTMPSIEASRGNPAAGLNRECVLPKRPHAVPCLSLEGVISGVLALVLSYLRAARRAKKTDRRGAVSDCKKGSGGPLGEKTYLNMSS